MILSYWLFVWWIMYSVGILIDNPKLFLLIGLIVNLMMLFVKVMRGSKTVLSFIIVNTVIKVIPLLFLMRTTISARDVESSLIVLILYVVWVIINMETVVRYMTNRSIPPFEHWWLSTILNKE